MKNLIENICFVCAIISAIGLTISVATYDITIFFFSVLFMFAFWGIAMIDISRK